MAKVFLMLNPTLMMGMAKRVWLDVGDVIQISLAHEIHISRIRFDDLDQSENQLVLTELLHGKSQHEHIVKNGRWLLLPTRRGYIEIVPKAISFNAKGDVDKMLVDIKETPAANLTHNLSISF